MITKAWSKAIELADELPSNISWGFHITDEDQGGTAGNAVFNIFAVKFMWSRLRLYLGLGEPAEQDENSQSWHYSGLTVSLIQPKEKRDDPDRPDEPDVPACPADGRLVADIASAGYGARF